MLTDIKIISAWEIEFCISVVKNRFLSLFFLTNSTKPGSNTGSLFKSQLFHASIFSLSRSRRVTFISGQLFAITAIVGPPTYPAPIQQMFFIKREIFINDFYYYT